MRPQVGTRTNMASCCSKNDIYMYVHVLTSFYFFSGLCKSLVKHFWKWQKELSIDIIAYDVYMYKTWNLCSWTNKCNNFQAKGLLNIEQRVLSLVSKPEILTLIFAMWPNYVHVLPRVKSLYQVLILTFHNVIWNLLETWYAQGATTVPSLETMGLLDTEQTFCLWFSTD